MAKGKNPSDAANAFVRVLLNEAGKLAGGISKQQWEDTLEYFGHRCAYTGASSLGVTPSGRESS